MNDSLFERVTFFNELMSFFNGYFDLAQYAMTTGRNHTPRDYDQLIDILHSASIQSKELIRKIPKNESQAFKKDIESFLSLISERLENIADRQIHLRGKSFDGEKYSFLDDRAYIKRDRNYEKKISDLGDKINRYKEETARMISA